MLAELLRRITVAGFSVRVSHDAERRALSVEVVSPERDGLTVAGTFLVADEACTDDMVQVELEAFMIRNRLMTYEQLHPADGY